jgi:muramoyltetrapeptide carboxypeptidase LdcA involved in peptidoglycan recycling
VQGVGTVRGRLIGGCMSVVEALKDTMLFPAADEFEDTILFFEVVSWAPECVAKALEDYHARGMLQGVRGILFGKPYDEYKYEEYRNVLAETLQKLGYGDMPLFYNMTFGHNDPKFLIPYGALAEMDAETGAFRILEPGVE